MGGLPPEYELEGLMHEMLKTQLELGKSISGTSQFLRFVLNLANENLVVIRTQLEEIQKLAAAIEECDCA